MLSTIFSPFSRWWDSQKERHFFLLGTISFFSFTMVMWALIFFTFLGGAQDPDLKDLTTWTWIGLVVGFTALIFAGPIFIEYHAQWTLLMEILQSTSKPELTRQRKEAEEAAKLLGSVWSTRLKNHFIEQGVIRGRQNQIDSDFVPEDIIINWWRTNDSRFSRTVPIQLLREPWFNRSLLFIGLTAVILQLYNMAWGLAKSESGVRENTLHIWEYLNGTQPGSYAAPYFDDISGWVLLLMSVLLLWLTMPAAGVRPELSENEKSWIDEEE
tara:strand:+ start:128 stop:937 length:810 start_codon:yes stop_codon:yes gene_type:complete